MADPYIDPLETQTYGAFCRDQMKAEVIGLVSELDGAVQFAIATQKKADETMKAELNRQQDPEVFQGDPVADARDVIVRFASYLGSLKGRPVALALFFRGQPPSVIARRRPTKLAGHLQHIADTLDKHKAKVKDAEAWIQELRAAHEAVAQLSKRETARKAEAVHLRPDLAAARQAWLEVYAANKTLIEGVLRHANKLALLPLVFDDLAEVHRAPGVTDDGPAEPPPPAGPTAPAPNR
jgi:hypothetical protein